MAFDLVPKLTKTFDLVFQSSAIRSSDQIPLNTRNSILIMEKNTISPSVNIRFLLSCFLMLRDI